MLWPQSASESISQAFYDKPIQILSDEIEKDEEGGIIRKSQTVSSEFMGNVKFNNLGEVASELGLSESIDICITCAPDITIGLNQLFKYNGKIYAVTGAVPSDSHLTITGRLWQSQ